MRLDRAWRSSGGMMRNSLASFFSSAVLNGNV
jgi:hypothetical protein